MPMLMNRMNTDTWNTFRPMTFFTRLVREIMV
jgi:hypothetical protein